MVIEGLGWAHAWKKQFGGASGGRMPLGALAVRSASLRLLRFVPSIPLGEEAVVFWVSSDEEPNDRIAVNSTGSAITSGHTC